MPNQKNSGDTDKFDHSDHPTSHSTEDDLRGQGTGNASVRTSASPTDADAGNKDDPKREEKR